MEFIRGNRVITGILGAGTLGGGALLGDVAVLNETPIERIETIAEERVEARQVGNVVETTLPWKGEDGVKIKYDMGEPTLTERFDDERKKQVITEKVDDFDGGFKVDILLREKPDANVFTYEIEGWENYDFFYQPALTAEEIKKGAIRPENIVGSYAVYHKTLVNHRVGGENYATGKVMHIPRPQVWSLSSPERKTWADLEIENGELRVIVPQVFLDKADYPVRVDPTFGYTSIGGTNLVFARNGSIVRRVGDTFEGTAGTLDSISVALNYSGSSETADTTVFLNQRNSVATDSHGEIASIETANLSVGTTASFYEFTASSESISTTDYVINIVGDENDIVGTSNFYRVNYDSSTAGETSDYYVEDYGDNGYSTAVAEDPWTDSPTVVDIEISIYATYTAGGGSSNPAHHQTETWY